MTRPQESLREWCESDLLRYRAVGRIIKFSIELTVALVGAAVLPIVVSVFVYRMPQLSIPAAQIGLMWITLSVAFLNKEYCFTTCDY